MTFFLVKHKMVNNHRADDIQTHKKDDTVKRWQMIADLQTKNIKKNLNTNSNANFCICHCCSRPDTTKWWKKWFHREKKKEYIWLNNIQIPCIYRCYSMMVAKFKFPQEWCSNLIIGSQCRHIQECLVSAQTLAQQKRKNHWKMWWVSPVVFCLIPMSVICWKIVCVCLLDVTFCHLLYVKTVGENKNPNFFFSYRK